MTAEPAPDWNVFQQIFAEHWEGFTRVYPRYDTRYDDGLVDKMLGCGNPDKMGSIAYRRGGGVLKRPALCEWRRALATPRCAQRGHRDVYPTLLQ
jgi:hypothetical protein